MTRRSQAFGILILLATIADTFDTEPAGVAGLTVLVRAQPALQNSLVDFLESLPTDRCGAWVVSGWEGVVTEAAAATRLSSLLNTWATSAKNSALKIAAAGVLKLARMRRV